jgi:hypothetical protein
MEWDVYILQRAYSVKPQQQMQLIEPTARLDSHTG